MALEVTAVERVVPAVAITSLPGAPVVVAGAIVVHGAVVPVVDLRPRLNASRRAVRLDDRFVILRCPTGLRALWVDDVIDVTSLEPEKADEAEPPGRTGRVVCQDGALLIRVDVAELLSADEEERVRNALEVYPD